MWQASSHLPKCSGKVKADHPAILFTKGVCTFGSKFPWSPNPVSVHRSV